jgi:hypothetical protein
MGTAAAVWVPTIAGVASAGATRAGVAVGRCRGKGTDAVVVGAPLAAGFAGVDLADGLAADFVSFADGLALAALPLGLVDPDFVAGFADFDGLALALDGLVLDDLLAGLDFESAWAAAASWRGCDFAALPEAGTGGASPAARAIGTTAKPVLATSAQIASCRHRLTVSAPRPIRITGAPAIPIALFGLTKP